MPWMLAIVITPLHGRAGRTFVRAGICSFFKLSASFFFRPSIFDNVEFFEVRSAAQARRPS